jgi:hypothetical protein
MPKYSNIMGVVIDAMVYQVKNEPILSFHVFILQPGNHLIKLIIQCAEKGSGI